MEKWMKTSKWEKKRVDKVQWVNNRQSSFDIGYTELNEVTHTKSELQTHSDTQQENRSDHFMNRVQPPDWDLDGIKG